MLLHNFAVLFKYPGRAVVRETFYKKNSLWNVFSWEGYLHNTRYCIKLALKIGAFSLNISKKHGAFKHHIVASSSLVQVIMLCFLMQVLLNIS